MRIFFPPFLLFIFYLPSNYVKHVLDGPNSLALLCGGVERIMAPSIADEATA